LKKKVCLNSQDDVLRMMVSALI